MPKRIDRPLELVTLNLFKGTKDTLKEFYPAPVGYNAAARQILDLHCKKLIELRSRQEPTDGPATHSDVADAIIAELVSKPSAA